MSADARWPLLMDLATACKLVTCTRHQFRAMVAAGLFPPGRRLPDGREMWHRGEMERAADRMWQMEAEASGERQKEDARRALDAYDPAALRPGGARRRPGVPLLPARRAKDTPAAA